MSTFCRKSYNSSYYAKNKERILLKRQIQKMSSSNRLNSSSDQLSLFDQSSRHFDRSNLIQKFNFETALILVLVMLVLSNSYLLLHDAVEFYRLNDNHGEASLASAVVVEGMLIALSIIRPSNVVLKYAAKCALILLFIYSSWSFCSVLIGKGYGVIEKRLSIDRQIERLENQIHEREVLINENIKRHRITIAGKLTLEKMAVERELSQLENERASTYATANETQKVNTVAMVVLRLILQFSNVVIVHHLRACLAKSTKRRPVVPLPNRMSAIRLVT